VSEEYELITRSLVNWWWTVEPVLRWCGLVRISRWWRRGWVDGVMDVVVVGILRGMRGKESRGANLRTGGERRCSSYIYCWSMSRSTPALKKGRKSFRRSSTNRANGVQSRVRFGDSRQDRFSFPPTKPNFTTPGSV